MGLFAALLCYGRHVTMPNHSGDFGLAWFGARAMIGGKNPYQLVGPGLEYNWPWPLVYPATSFVAALFVSWLPHLTAILVFVFISSALLAWSVTANGWFRLPMFGSAPFVVAAGAAQWSPLFTAAMTIPVLAFFFAAKPTIGIAMAVAGSRRVQIWAIAGAVVLGAASLILFPSWPLLWLRQLHFAVQMAPPVLRYGGPFILLALLRWRLPEARLILALACIPQVGSWYEALPLFLVPATYRETMVLAMASSIGFLLGEQRPDGLSESQINGFVGSLMIATVYLPAIVMLLRRADVVPPTGRPRLRGMYSLRALRRNPR